MAAISRIMAYAAVFGGLAGCARPFPFEGRWEGTMSVPVRPGTNPSIAITLNRVQLVLEPNMRFTLLQSGITRSGTWRASGTVATLQPVAVLNRPVSRDTEEIKLAAQSDGTLKLDDPNDLSEAPVILTRALQP